MENNYKTFINTLTDYLNNFFSEQAEFIKCKEGCSYCCEYGEYPFSEPEFEYICKGFNELDKDTKEIVIKNIKKVISDKNKSKEHNYMYCCPFLINHRCSVYNYRGIICRTFGLLAEHNDGSYTIPFCHQLGLNYHAVYDNESGTIIDEKNGIKLSKKEPKAYRITREQILSLSLAKTLNINWGESKTLIDYLEKII